MNSENKMTTKQAQDMLVITEMYNIAFNKLPDAEGLAYWMNDIANGHSLHDVARSIGTHLQPFSFEGTQNVIDTFYMNAIDKHATVDVQNHWGVLALNAVPSYELMYEMALALTGQPTDSWAGILF